MVVVWGTRMTDLVAFPVEPTLDEPDSDTTSMLDNRMMIFCARGLEVASTNSCEAGSSTTAVLVVMAIFSSVVVAVDQAAAVTRGYGLAEPVLDADPGAMRAVLPE